LKIGLVIYGALQTRSGGYLYDRKLVEHLRREGDAVEVVSLGWRNYASHMRDNLSSSLRRRLEHLQVDILLQDELNHPSLFWLNRRLNIKLPIVSIVHHLRSSELRPAWQNRLYAILERAYLRSVGGFIFNSRTTQAAVRTLSGEERPGVVAYPAADHLEVEIADDEIVRRARQSGPLRLVFVGNLIPRKGLHTLLSALARMPADSVTLDVCGSLEVDKVYAAALCRLVASLKLDASVRLHGALDYAGLVGALRSAQALVVPSSYEGFGIVYLEAMSLGLPCIGTTAGAAGEIIIDGENGFLVPPEDTRALAACLQRLAQETGLRERMSLRARQRFLEHPTWKQMGEEIRFFLTKMI
jgi:glycosyltransferase involved in cell wall biosynthesis